MICFALQHVEPHNSATDDEFMRLRLGAHALCTRALYAIRRSHKHGSQTCPCRLRNLKMTRAEDTAPSMHTIVGPHKQHCTHAYRTWWRVDADICVGAGLVGALSGAALATAVAIRSYGT